MVVGAKKTKTSNRSDSEWIKEGVGKRHIKVPKLVHLNMFCMYSDVAAHSSWHSEVAVCSYQGSRIPPAPFALEISVSSH